MAINKVIYGNTTLMDITDSTVDTDNMLTGTKAYGANGEPVIGGVVESWTGTMAQYLQEASNIPDGTQVNILGDFTPDGFPAIHYSTDEQIIGTWISGKPLYQKTITGSATFNTTDYVTIGVLNAGVVVINFFGYYKKDGSTFNLNTPNPSNYNYGRSTVIDADGVTIKGKFGTGVTGTYDYAVTVQYTKTTD